MQTDESRAEQVSKVLAAPASLEADPQLMARVFPPVTGRLTQIHVQLGDTVKQGQLLVTLSSPDFMQSQGEFIKARGVLNVAERNLHRQDELYKAKISAQKDFEQAQSDLTAAQSDLNAASARLRSYGFDPDKDQLGQMLQLYAPVSGKVVDMATGKGEFKNDPNSPLMTIADLSTVWLTAFVQEKDLRFLKKGEEVDATFSAYPDETFKGTVLFVGDIIDPDTRSTKTRIAVPNPDGKFKPGMFATVSFHGYPEEQITVPTSAVVQLGAAAFVYQEIKPGIYIPRQVEVGQQVGDRIVVRRGLPANARIVSKGGVMLP